MNEEKQTFEGWEMYHHKNGAGCSVWFSEFCAVFDEDGQSVIVADPVGHKGEDETHPHIKTATAFFNQHFKEGRDIGTAELDSWISWREIFAKGSENEDSVLKAGRLACLEEAESEIERLKQEAKQ
jgi:hypothetical protein